MSLNYYGWGQGFVALVDSLNDTGGKMLEGNTTHIVHPHYRLTVVTALADACHQRNLS